jgi:hypothetical protein
MIDYSIRLLYRLRRPLTSKRRFKTISALEMVVLNWIEGALDYLESKEQKKGKL